MKKVWKHRICAAILAFVMVFTTALVDVKPVFAKDGGKKELAVGATCELEVSDNSLLNDTYSWSSQQPGVATVTKKGSYNDHIGVVTAVAPGNATIKCEHKWKKFEGIKLKEKREEVTFQVKVNKRGAEFTDTVTKFTYNGANQTLNESQIRALLDQKLSNEIANISDVKVTYPANMTDAGEYTIKVSTPETATYVAGQKDFKVVIEKANVTVVKAPVAPDMESDTFGSKIGDVPLTGGYVTGVKGETLSGTWSWTKDSASDDLTAFWGTELEEKAVFTPNSANYNTGSAKVSVYVYWYGYREVAVNAANAVYTGQPYVGVTAEAELSEQGKHSWSTKVNASQLIENGLQIAFYQGSYASLNDLDLAIANGTACALSTTPVDAGEYTALVYMPSNKNTVSAFKDGKIVSLKGVAGFRKSCPFTIAPKAITADMVTPNGSIYSGQEITVSVADGTKALVEGTDYTVTYANNVNAGEATATVVGTGNYTGTVNVSYQIGAKTLENEDVTVSIANNGEKRFTGREITLASDEITVKDGQTTLVNGTDYSLTYSDNTAIGQATVTITFKGNYSGQVTANFAIVNKEEATLYKKIGWKYETLGKVALSDEFVTNHINDSNINKIISTRPSEIATYVVDKDNLLPEGFGYIKLSRQLDGWHVDCYDRVDATYYIIKDASKAPTTMKSDSSEFYNKIMKGALKVNYITGNELEEGKNVTDIEGYFMVRPSLEDECNAIMSLGYTLAEIVNKNLAIDYYRIIDENGSLHVDGRLVQQIKDEEGKVIDILPYNEEPEVITVTFNDYNGNFISQKEYAYGESVDEKDVPVLDDSNLSGITYTGWDKEVSELAGLTKSVTVTAQATMDITFLSGTQEEPVTEVVSVAYGTDARELVPEAVEIEGFDFTGWDKEEALENVLEPITLVATYKIKTFDVNFLDYDGSVISTYTVNYGEDAEAPADPTREGYTFKGWDKAFKNIVEALNVTASYEINTYKVVFVDYNDDVLSTQTVNYGEDAKAPANPTRSGYNFTGWDSSFTKVSKDLTVKATYSEIIIIPDEIDEDNIIDIEPTNPVPLAPSEPEEEEPAGPQTPADPQTPAGPQAPAVPAPAEVAAAPAAVAPVAPAAVAPVAPAAVVPAPAQPEVAPQVEETPEEVADIDDEVAPQAAADEEVDIEDVEAPKAAPGNCYIHWIVLLLTLFFITYYVVRELLTRRNQAEAKIRA